MRIRKSVISTLSILTLMSLSPLTVHSNEHRRQLKDEVYVADNHSFPCKPSTTFRTAQKATVDSNTNSLTEAGQPNELFPVIILEEKSGTQVVINLGLLANDINPNSSSVNDRYQIRLKGKAVTVPCQARY